METVRRDGSQEAERAAAETAGQSKFRRICVFCGSSSGKNPSYQIAAIQLGNQLVLLFFFDSFKKLERIREKDGKLLLIIS